MFKPEEKISMFKVILSAEQHGNERMLLKDVADGGFDEFIKHTVAARMCEQFIKLLCDDELLEKRYVIAQGIHQHIAQEDTTIKNLTNIILNLPKMYKYFSSEILEDEEDGEEDV